MKFALIELWKFLQTSKTIPEHSAHLDNLAFPHTAFQSAWEVVSARAGVPDLRLRDLRRDWVTRLAKLGYSDRLAQRGAGHQQMQMTFGYTEFDMEAALQAKAVLDSALEIESLRNS